MIWLGLFLALASLPGYTSAAIPAGWAALSLILPIVAWQSASPRWPHVAMGLFLIYAFASIAWSIEPLDGIYRLWQFLLIAGCFWLGTVREPRFILIGLAWGFMISTMIAAGQWVGIEFVVRYNWNNYPGLYFAGVFAGAVGVMLMVALLCERLYLLAACCIPGIALASAYSRGAIAAAVVGVASIYLRRVWLPVIAVVILVAYVILSNHNSDLERRAIWQGSVSLLTWFGHGAGSYVDLLVTTPFGITRAEHAHNDALQLWFEFGVGAIPFLGLWLALCLQTRSKHWPVIVTFTIFSVFFFPLYTPIPAAIFAICAGASVRDWRSASDLLHSFRHLRLLRQATPAIPVPLPTKAGLA